MSVESVLAMPGVIATDRDQVCLLLHLSSFFPIYSVFPSSSSFLSPPTPLLFLISPTFLHLSSSFFSPSSHPPHPFTSTSIFLLHTHLYIIIQRVESLPVECVSVTSVSHDTRRNGSQRQENTNSTTTSFLHSRSPTAASIQSTLPQEKLPQPQPQLKRQHQQSLVQPPLISGNKTSQLITA